MARVGWYGVVGFSSVVVPQQDRHVGDISLVRDYIVLVVSKCYESYPVFQFEILNPNFPCFER